MNQQQVEKSSECDICNKICKSYRGMKIHRFHCAKKQTVKASLQTPVKASLQTSVEANLQTPVKVDIVVPVIPSAVIEVVPKADTPSAAPKVDQVKCVECKQEIQGDTIFTCTNGDHRVCNGCFKKLAIRTINLRSGSIKCPKCNKSRCCTQVNRELAQGYLYFHALSNWYFQKGSDISWGVEKTLVQEMTKTLDPLMLKLQAEQDSFVMQFLQEFRAAGYTYYNAFGGTSSKGLTYDEMWFMAGTSKFVTKDEHMLHKVKTAMKGMKYAFITQPTKQ